MPDLKDNKPYLAESDPYTMFESDSTKWPPLKVPYSAELKMSAFYFDWEEWKLEPFHNMKIHSYIDAEGNRALRMAEMNLPIKGKVSCNTYIDFNEKLIVDSDPHDKTKCYEFHLKNTFSIHDYVDKLKTPEGGLTTYLGTRSVRWETHKTHKERKLYHTFKLKQKILDMELTHRIYFDWETNELAYVELITPVHLVMKVENGIKERKFSDEDFKNVLTECPRKPSIFSHIKQH